MPHSCHTHCVRVRKYVHVQTCAQTKAHQMGLACRDIDADRAAQRKTLTSQLHTHATPRMRTRTPRQASAHTCTRTHNIGRCRSTATLVAHSRMRHERVLACARMCLEACTQVRAHTRTHIVVRRLWQWVRQQEVCRLATGPSAVVGMAHRRTQRSKPKLRTT